MRKLLITTLFATYTLTGWSQATQENTLIINDGSLSAPITIHLSSDQSAVIKKGDELFTVNIDNKNDIIYLDNKSDNDKIIKKLGIDTNFINKSIQQNSNLSHLERLLNYASQQNQRTLYINDGSEIPAEEELVSANNATGESVNASEGNSLIWWIALPLIGLIVGFFVGKATQNKTATPSEIEVDEEAQVEISTIKNDAPAPTQERKTRTQVNINQLKTKYDKLREDSKVLKQNYADLKQNHKELKQLNEADLQYYKVAYNDIILPLQNALDTGNLTEIFRLMSIASIQYAAITRSKLVKKQNYDITNINILLKQPSDKDSYPVISNQTPLDKTPKQLQQLISVLTQLGVKDLNNYILQGYNLNNL